MPPLGNLRVRALAVVGITALLAVACSSESPSALTVNGKDVGQSAVDKDFATIAKNTQLKSQLAQSGGKLPAELKAAWLTALVETQIAENVVQKADTKITKDDRIAAQQWAGQFFGSEAVVSAFPKSFENALIARYANVPAYVRTHTKPPTDADVRTSYDSSLARSCTSRRFISHILVADEATAKSLAAQLAAGGDFEKLAAQSSTDTQSGPNGGVLGCIDDQQVDPAFAAAAAAVPLGQVSAPIKTQFGWHLIKAQDVEQALPFETVKSEIRRDLVEHGAQGQRKLLALMAKAKVTVASRFGRWVVKGGSGRVEPPKSSATSTTSRPGSSSSTSSTTAP